MIFALCKLLHKDLDEVAEMPVTKALFLLFGIIDDAKRRSGNA